MADYTLRVHRVMDHIRGHLAEDLSLARLADLAHFSRFHFHRVFKSVAGETVAAFTRRARLERAVYLMRGAPHRELTSIALEVGFATPSDFSRVFRAAFGVAPSHWDRKSRLDEAEDFSIDAGADEEMFPVTLVEHAACRVAYVRVQNPWSGDGLARGYARLCEALRGIAGPPQAALVGLSWDSEKATPIERLHYDLGFVLASDAVPPPALGIHEFPAVRAAEVHCTSLRQTASAWAFLYEQWFPTSGFEPAEMPAMKRFRQAPRAFDSGAWDLDCSIAVRPATD